MIDLDLKSTEEESQLQIVKEDNFNDDEEDLLDDELFAHQIKVGDTEKLQEEAEISTCQGLMMHTNKISADHISADQISADHISADQISADHISVDQICESKSVVKIGSRTLDELPSGLSELKVDEIAAEKFVVRNQGKFEDILKTSMPNDFNNRSLHRTLSESQHHAHGTTIALIAGKNGVILASDGMATGIGDKLLDLNSRKLHRISNNCICAIGGYLERGLYFMDLVKQELRRGKILAIEDMASFVKRKSTLYLGNLARKWRRLSKVDRELKEEEEKKKDFVIVFAGFPNRRNGRRPCVSMAWNHNYRVLQRPFYCWSSDDRFAKIGMDYIGEQWQRLKSFKDNEEVWANQVVQVLKEAIMEVSGADKYTGGTIRAWQVTQDGINCHPNGVCPDPNPI